MWLALGKPVTYALDNISRNTISKYSANSNTLPPVAGRLVLAAIYIVIY